MLYFIAMCTEKPINVSTAYYIKTSEILIFHIKMLNINDKVHFKVVSVFSTGISVNPGHFGNSMYRTKSDALATYYKILFIILVHVIRYDLYVMVDQCIMFY